MTEFSLMQWHYVIAFVVASFTASAGKGHQFEALYFVLIIIFGGFDETQIIVITFLHGFLIFLNELYRGANQR